MPKLTNEEKAQKYLESVGIDCYVVSSGVEDENGNMIDELCVTTWTRDLKNAVDFPVTKSEVEWYAECYDTKFNQESQTLPS